MQRTLIEIGASVGASAVMVAATIVGGQMLKATPPAVESERPAHVGCDTRRLAPVNGAAVQAFSRLCFGPRGVESVVDLAARPTGGVYSAWMAYVDRPTAVRTGECASPELVTPGRVASGIANGEGRLTLANDVPGLQVRANGLVEILVVEHGQPTTDSAPDRARELLSWHSAWSDPGAAPTDFEQPSSALLGCATFWVRGGAEQTEH